MSFQRGFLGRGFGPARPKIDTKNEKSPSKVVEAATQETMKPTSPLRRRGLIATQVGREGVDDASQHAGSEHAGALKSSSSNQFTQRAGRGGFSNSLGAGRQNGKTEPQRVLAEDALDDGSPIPRLLDHIDAQIPF